MTCSILPDSNARVICWTASTTAVSELRSECCCVSVISVLQAESLAIEGRGSRVREVRRLTGICDKAPHGGSKVCRAAILRGRTLQTEHLEFALERSGVAPYLLVCGRPLERICIAPNAAEAVCC